MEMNKGEAERCREIAKKHLRAGNHRQAMKFFDKSLRLYALPGVDAMRDRAKSELEKEESASNASSAASSSHSSHNHHKETPGVRRRETASASEESSRPYTAEQLQMVRKIKACKTHYEVLSVSKDADENEIKKAYRKVIILAEKHV